MTTFREQIFLAALGVVAVGVVLMAVGFVLTRVRRTAPLGDPTSLDGGEPVRGLAQVTAPRAQSPFADLADLVPAAPVLVMPTMPALWQPASMASTATRNVLPRR